MSLSCPDISIISLSLELEYDPCPEYESAEGTGVGMFSGRGVGSGVDESELKSLLILGSKVININVSNLHIIKQ